VNVSTDKIRQNRQNPCPHGAYTVTGRMFRTALFDSPKWKTIQISMNRRTDKQTVV